ncbi:hypothetical protein HPB50_025441 [Hyalomma asiaticum]|uniref:Uncharacterized protein n=1 Tax=Hyalomma asiaticum TaxID=266040 RepID=A0ACB7RL85_HYAAI|nr:hypothetical protein HPB50_025441 [Hyalomma asiaticum]
MPRPSRSLSLAPRERDFDIAFGINFLAEQEVNRIYTCGRFYKEGHGPGLLSRRTRTLGVHLIVASRSERSTYSGEERRLKKKCPFPFCATHENRGSEGSSYLAGCVGGVARIRTIGNGRRCFSLLLSTPPPLACACYVYAHTRRIVGVTGSFYDDRG